MEATTLAICIPSAGCARGCPYCVSRMTWAPEVNEAMFLERLPLALRMADRARVTDVILTGKGEPMAPDTQGLTMNVARQCTRDGFPVVLQTAMDEFCQGDLRVLAQHGVGTFALSVDTAKGSKWRADCLRWAAAEGMIPRVTVVLTKDAMQASPEEWLTWARAAGVRQLTFRAITVPEGCAATKEARETKDWIWENDKETVELRAEWFVAMHEAFSFGNAWLVRRLPYGAWVYDAGGVSVTLFPTCVQDSNHDGNVRSLIFHQDGHLYTTWGSPASLVF